MFRTVSDSFRCNRNPPSGSVFTHHVVIDLGVYTGVPVTGGFVSHPVGTPVLVGH